MRDFSCGDIIDLAIGDTPIRLARKEQIVEAVDSFIDEYFADSVVAEITGAGDNKGVCVSVKLMDFQECDTNSGVVMNLIKNSGSLRVEWASQSSLFVRVAIDQERDG